jgi:hypothetical protein
MSAEAPSQLSRQLKVSEFVDGQLFSPHRSQAKQMKLAKKKPVTNFLSHMVLVRTP